ncbi:MAG TPA: SDR family oxidoreductase [Burkholderiales bacterium]
MKLRDSRVLITGAGSGIGRALALELARRGARLVLVGRNRERLVQAASEIRGLKGDAFVCVLDLAGSAGHDAAVGFCAEELGGLDILVNNAGTVGFGDFATQQPSEIDNLVRTNLTGPLLLTRAALPGMIARGQGQIVNVGSTFGAIAFAHFAAYSATKFALRGFSEALRRELEGTGVSVTYISPRATRTGANPEAVYRITEQAGNAVDTPEAIAPRIAAAIESGRRELQIGAPESVFTRINALFPRIVDAALRKQNRAAREVISGAAR